MTVQFDQSGYSGITSGVLSPETISGLINVGAGANGTANRALIFSASFTNVSAAVISAVSVTWHGQAMTAIISETDTSSGTFVFGLVAPDTGANDFVLTYTGVAAGRVDVSALSVVGANQTGGATTFANSTSGTGSSSPASVTITSATGDICFATHTNGSNFTTASDTDIGHDNGGTVGANASNWGAGAASKALTYTCGSGTWKSLGVDIAAVGGGSASGPLYMHRTQQRLH